MRLLAELIDYEGEIAILSATTTAPNQNAVDRGDAGRIGQAGVRPDETGAGRLR